MQKQQQCRGDAMLQLANLSTRKSCLFHRLLGFMKREHLSSGWQWLKFMSLMALMICSSTQAAASITPPMTLVPSVNVNETDQAGYRGGSVSSMAISPTGVIGSIGNFTSYRGLGKPGMFFHAPDFSPAAGYNDYADNAALDSMSNLAALRDGSFLFSDYTGGIGINSIWRITPDGTRSKMNNATWGNFTNVFKILQHPSDDNAAYAAVFVAAGTYKVIKFDLDTGNADTNFIFKRTGSGVANYKDVIFNAAGNLLVAQQGFRPREVNPATGAVLATYT
ncbi:MAG: hypothetical protein KDI44_03885, partial [Thiothrix sp.]|nr:hypothetical protein [Thiothrix sp.]